MLAGGQVEDQMTEVTVRGWLLSAVSLASSPITRSLSADWLGL